MNEQQLRAHAANLEAWAVAMADPQQATVYREQAKIWTWVTDHVEDLLTKEEAE